MMDLIIIDSEEIICIIAVIFFTFVGSFSKDYLNLFNQRSKKMDMKRILISTVAAFIISYASSDLVIRLIGFKGLIGVSYVIGLSGFDLLNRMNSIEKLFHLIRFIMYNIKNYDKIDDIEETLDAGRARKNNIKHSDHSNEICNRYR